MATKNLVPRADSEGKLGLKIDGSDRRWLEVNAVSGSFDQAKIDNLLNTQDQPLFAAGDNITISYDAQGNLGAQYTISSTAAGSSVDTNKISQGNSSVEVVDTDGTKKIKFKLDNTEVWKIEDTNGHLKPVTTNDTDIGEANNRVRNLYLSDSGIKLATGDISLDTSTKRLKYTHSSVDNVLPLTKVVRLATTQNIDLSTTTSIDNQTLNNGDRVLVKNQSTSSENGIYTYDPGATPKLQRASDFDTSQSFANIIVNVREGSNNSGNLYHSLVNSTNGESIIGTNNQLWVQINNEGITFGNLSDIGADLVDDDNFIVDDGGNGTTTRKSALSRLKKYIFSAISGDATATEAGVLTIEDGAVENSMLANSSITFGSTAVALGGTVSIQGTSDEVVVSESSGTFTIGLPDATTIATSLAVPTINLSGQTAALSLNSNKITNLGSPDDDTDAATKEYVDTVAQGLNIKNAVRAASSVALSGFTYNSNVFTESSATGALTLDTNVVLVNDDRVLLKNQGNKIHNGIYVVAGIDGSSAVTLTRATDMAASSSAAGIFMFVQEGTDNGDKGFVCTSDSGSDVVGSNNLTFTQFSGAGNITAGSALTKSGNTLNVVVDNNSIEVSNSLRVKALGITNAMLAGSINDSKLNQITTENKVAISSLDIDGTNTETIDDLASNDLLIAHDKSDLTDPAVKNITAENISKYVLGRITDGASVDTDGNLTISDTSISGSMLHNDVISGQDAFGNSDPVADEDLLLVYDTSSTSLKKITKSDLVSGASASIDFTNLSEIASVDDEADHLLINDSSESGTNKKITVSDLVKSKYLLNLDSHSTNTTKEVAPNTHLILANTNTKYRIDLSTSNVSNGDLIKISIDFPTNSTQNRLLVQSILIDNRRLYHPRDFASKNIEFVYSNGWKALNIEKYAGKSDAGNVIDLNTPQSLDEANINGGGIVLTGDHGAIQINLPNQGTMSGWNLRTVPFSLKFIVGADNKPNIVFNSTSSILSSHDTSNSPSFSKISSQTITSAEKLKIIKVHWVTHHTQSAWLIEDPVNFGSVSLKELADVYWDPTVASSADNTVLVSKTSNPAGIYGQKLDSDFMKTKDSEGSAAIIRDVISTGAIGTDEIGDNQVDFAKIKKSLPYRILGTVNGNLTEGGTAENISDVKVYTDFNTHATDLDNSLISENSSLATLTATRNFVEKSLSSLNFTSSSQGARTLTLSNSNPIVELLDTDLGKTTTINIENITPPGNPGYNSTNITALSYASKSFIKTGKDSPNDAKLRNATPVKEYQILLPPASEAEPGSVFGIKFVEKSNVQVYSHYYCVPANADPKPGVYGSTTYSNTIPNAVFVDDSTKGAQYNNFNHYGKHARIDSVVLFELVYDANYTGPDGTPNLDAYIWRLTDIK